MPPCLVSFKSFQNSGGDSGSHLPSDDNSAARSHYTESRDKLEAPLLAPSLLANSKARWHDAFRSSGAMGNKTGIAKPAILWLQAF